MAPFRVRPLYCFHISANHHLWSRSPTSSCAVTHLVPYLGRLSRYTLLCTGWVDLSIRILNRLCILLCRSYLGRLCIVLRYCRGRSAVPSSVCVTWTGPCLRINASRPSRGTQVDGLLGGHATTLCRIQQHPLPGYTYFRASLLARTVGWGFWQSFSITHAMTPWTLMRPCSAV